MDCYENMRFRKQQEFKRWLQVQYLYTKKKNRCQNRKNHNFRRYKRRQTIHFKGIAKNNKNISTHLLTWLTESAMIAFNESGNIIVICVYAGGGVHMNISKFTQNHKK